MTESMKNARSGRCESGRVAARWKGMPPVDGVDTGVALVTAIEICGETKAEWPDGVPVECPLTLASGLDDLLDAAPDLDLAAAALEAMDRQYEPSCDEDDVALAEAREAYLDRMGEAVCGADGTAPNPYRPQRMDRREREERRRLRRASS